ncbi:hypothetical protein [Dyadobacter psychrophilus]|uniref:Uncharacterized protein n=1 Tax=Dyadobacter psychrophilus TaxID=651661 RepID=A0A1T5CJG3_9BACT|nr:hypothetical protein [Dyadobacter psychrophilus]SKB59493.1 hypothetical protein SAMN05660293_01292 [Dyadobacter psychrophilus]
MKCPYSIIILMVAGFNQLVFAQKKEKGSFPTYDQIRGNKSEIYDFVAPQSIQVNPTSAVPETGKYTLIKRSIVTEHGFDVFGYPKDSVTYILNGRKEKDAQRAEKEIRTKSKNITDISIGAVDSKGRRVIRIDYEQAPQH